MILLFGKILLKGFVAQEAGFIFLPFFSLQLFFKEEKLILRIIKIYIK